MPRRRLFNKRVLFMTGKGGVGKTTLSAAVAVAAKERGQKVLIVEVGQTANLGYLFDKKIPPYVETQLESNITALSLDPFLAFQEYVEKMARVKKVADWILNNQVMQYLTQAAPGWRELITVGKIWHLESMTIGYKKRPKYDMIIVDAPATGHGISFLRIPAVILDVMKFGPVRHQTFEVQKMLLDPERTMLNVVTLPEEMPVNEAVFLHNAAKESLKIHTGYTFVNSVFLPLFDSEEQKIYDKLQKDKKSFDKLKGMFPDKGQALVKAAEQRIARAEQSEHYRKMAEERIGPPVVAIPHYYEGKMDRETLGHIARVISDSVEQGGD